MLVYLFVRLADRFFVGSLVCCLLLGWFVLFGVVYDRCVSFSDFMDLFSNWFVHSLDLLICEALIPGLLKACFVPFL